MTDPNTENDRVTVSQSELETLIGKLIKRYQKQGAFSSKYDVKTAPKASEEHAEETQYNYQNQERKLDLIERIVRLEEGQKYILDKMETQFKAVNQRFEDMNKRLDDMNKRLDDMNKNFNQRFMSLQWFITVGFTVLGLLMVLLGFLAK